MNLSITEAVLAASQYTELAILIKATFFLVFGLIVAGIAFRARASWRHLIFTTTFAALIALPLVAFLAPEMTVEVPAENIGTRVESSAISEPVVTKSTTSEAVQPAVSTSASGSMPTLASLLRGLWIAGGSLMVLLLAIDLWRVRSFCRNALPSARLKDLTEEIAQAGGLKRPVKVLVHEEIKSPVTYGALRPVIVFPTDAEDWPAADLQRAIVHELEHIRRGDWATQLAARTVCAAYWFHPLVWVTWRRFCLEAERACDDEVVRQAEHTEYADQLVSLSKRFPNVQTQPVLSMARRSDLARRVYSLLDSGQRRGRAGLAAIGCSVAIGGLLVLSIGPFRAVAQSIAASDPYAAIPVRQEGLEQKCSTLDRALLTASEEGAADDIEALLNAGADVNCPHTGDGSPLIVAARNNELGAVRLLLDRGADVNLGVPGDGSALIAAARSGNTKIVELLLDRGAEVDLYVEGDENALISASGEGRLDVVKLLVSRGADINARYQVPLSAETDEKEWRSALSMAKRNGHDEIASYLISLGARE